MNSSDGRMNVSPANLAFLTIYNPSLSNSDETLKDQILYYHSTDEFGNPSSKHGRPKPSDVENERLRQIGLAQGMVEFAKYACGIMALTCRTQH